LAIPINGSFSGLRRDLQFNKGRLESQQVKIRTIKGQWLGALQSTFVRAKPSTIFVE
jgi:hypothetical protein